MSRNSQQASKKRFAIVVGLASTIGIAWLLMRGPGVDQIGEEIVSAEVLKVIQRKTSTASQQPGIGLGIAVVELPDGGRARVFAPLSKVTTGAKIMVRVKPFSDGSRHVTGGGEKPLPD